MGCLPLSPSKPVGKRNKASAIPLETTFSATILSSEAASEKTATGSSAALFENQKHVANKTFPVKDVEFDADVIVVGAGLSGLIAASELVKEGVSVKVIEAQDRVGGRTLDHVTEQGTVLEMGGQWIGPGQTEILKLATELGLTTHETYDKGESIYRSTDGVVKRYKNNIPCSVLASLDLYWVIKKINRLSKQVPAMTPSEAKNARWSDERSIGCWIDDTLKTNEGRQLMRLAIKAVYAEDSESVSFLDLLATVAGAGGDIENVLSDAQTTRFVQGPQRICISLAERLGTEIVQLGEKVIRIEQFTPASFSGKPKSAAAEGEGEAGEAEAEATQGAIGYQLTTLSGHTFYAPRIVITLPRPLITNIDFAPPLPTNLIQYYRRQPMGSVIKYNLVYPTPFWRDSGLNASMINADESTPVQMTYDNSPPDGSQGVIVAFILGTNSRHWLNDYPTTSERTSTIVRFLSTVFGEKTKTNLLEVHEKMWATDPFATGGYGSFNPPGVLTLFKTQERQGMAVVNHSIYFAGDATSEIWQGYMEGAVLSGQRAVERILQDRKRERS